MESISFYTAGLHGRDEGNDLENYSTPLSLKSIFPFEQWSKLRHFAPSRFIVTQSDLTSCLAGLPESLQSVELSFLVFVDNGNRWHRFVREMRKQIREKRLWPDLRPNVTIRYHRGIRFPGRALWFGKEIEDFSFEDGVNPFLFPPEKPLSVRYGIQEDAIDPENPFFNPLHETE